MEPDGIASDYELSSSRVHEMDIERLLSNPSNVNPRSLRELEADLATERRRRQRVSAREAVLAALA